MSMKRQSPTKKQNKAPSEAASSILNFYQPSVQPVGKIKQSSQFEFAKSSREQMGASRFAQKSSRANNRVFPAATNKTHPVKLQYNDIDLDSSMRLRNKQKIVMNPLNYDLVAQDILKAPQLIETAHNYSESMENAVDQSRNNQSLFDQSKSAIAMNRNDQVNIIDHHNRMQLNKSELRQRKTTNFFLEDEILEKFQTAECRKMSLPQALATKTVQRKSPFQYQKINDT